MFNDSGIRSFSNQFRLPEKESTSPGTDMVKSTRRIRHSKKRAQDRSKLPYVLNSVDGVVAT